MFKEKTTSDDGNTETIIGASVKVKGNFDSEGNIIIKGEVDGTLKTKNDIRIEKDALVKASITAENIYLAGQVQGNLKSKGTIHLANNARITGDIVAQHLIIEDGAIFNGQCKMGRSDEKQINEQAEIE